MSQSLGLKLQSRRHLTNASNLSATRSNGATCEGGIVSWVTDELVVGNSGEVACDVGVAIEVIGEKLSVARVFELLAVEHPQMMKQQSVKSRPSLRAARNLMFIDAVFLDVCTSAKLC